MKHRFRSVMLAIAGFVAVAAMPGRAKPPDVPDDTLTDFNVAADDSTADIAILRAVQRTERADGSRVRRPPAIRIARIVRLDESESPRAPGSQHVRLRSGEYGIDYVCSMKDKWISGKITKTFAGGRRYFIYCESRNWAHLELKFAEVP